jgi:hypothetical protein
MLGSRTLRAVPLAACFSAAALAAAAPALADRHARGSGSPVGLGSQKSVTTTVIQPTSGTQNVQGVVQSLTSSSIVVRLLDGTTIGVPVSSKTKVTINGRGARLTDVRPGFVLAATWKAGQPALTLSVLRPS